MASPSEPVRISRRLSRVLLTLLVGAIGLIDYWTGTEVSLSIFFLIPIALGAWFVGPRTGLALSLLSALAWLKADLDGGHVYSHPTIPYWNALVRLGFFTILSVVLSGRKRSEQRILRLARARSEFTSTVSHELRTPLACIKEGIDIVADGSSGSLTEAQAAHLNTAKRNVDRLSRLLDNVLDYQKLEAGRMEFALRDCAPQPLVEAAVDGFALLARRKGIALEVQAGEDLPRVRCDPDGIQQVLANLIQNAIKFTDAGGVQVVTTAEEATVRIAVQDQGTGIRPEDLSRLFRDFTQLGDPIGGRRSGTGLGLVIARAIVRGHGGELAVESTPGVGSTFSFRLPVAEAGAAVPPSRGPRRVEALAGRPA